MNKLKCWLVTEDYEFMDDDDDDDDDDDRIDDGSTTFLMVEPY